MTVNQRFKLLISYLKSGSHIKNQKDLGALLGYETESGFSQVVNGKVPIPETLYSKLKTLYPFVNIKWLKDDFGEMIIGSPSIVENSITNQSIEVGNSPRRIPFFDIDFSSGFEMVVNDQTINPSYYFYHPDFEKAEFAVRNSGKSMSNIIGPNDIIGMRRVENWKDYFPEGEVYGVVTSNDMRTVKHVRRDNESGNLILIPDPQDEYKHLYPEYEKLPINMVMGFFQVIAAMDLKKLSF